MTCELAKKLAQIGQKMDESQSYEEWEEYNEIADELCLKISNCDIKCGNEACWGLQNSDLIELEFAESQF